MGFLRNKIYLTFKYFLLFLFLGYYCGVTMFFHAHLNNGEVIVHSHPYRHDPSNKSPFERHKHSKGEYALIHHFNKTVFEETEISSVLPDPVISYFDLSIIPISCDFQSYDRLGFQLRAPPHSI